MEIFTIDRLNKKIGLLILCSTLLSIPIIIENVDGFKNRGSQIIVNLQPGESITGEWLLLSEQDKTVDIKISVVGEGAELITVVDKITAEPNIWYTLEITISVPEDHPNDVHLEPIVYALISGEQKEGTVNINLRMMHPLSITIGNPVVEETLVEEPVETMEEPEVMDKQQEEPEKEFTPFVRPSRVEMPPITIILVRQPRHCRIFPERHSACQVPDSTRYSLAKLTVRIFPELLQEIEVVTSHRRLDDVHFGTVLCHKPQQFDQVRF